MLMIKDQQEKQSMVCISIL